MARHISTERGKRIFRNSYHDVESWISGTITPHSSPLISSLEELINLSRGAKTVYHLSSHIHHLHTSPADISLSLDNSQEMIRQSSHNSLTHTHISPSPQCGGVERKLKSQLCLQHNLTTHDFSRTHIL